MYKNFVKRLLDIVISGLACIVLSPILIVLMILGTIFMQGNPFFIYPRAGKREKVFNLIKFRSMTDLKDENGNFLPDEIRLNKYGRIIRSTSLDELPELINIFLGHMSIVGPRPLPCTYLAFYTEEERHRHDVRPGLTGLAQINGRNAISWEERFRYDLEYISNITLKNDVKIILGTICKVVRRENIGEGTATVKSLHRVRANSEKETVQRGSE